MINLKDKTGEKVPNVSFRVQNDSNTWQDITTKDLFDNKKVIVFSLPGAYTPTCSSSHLPRYNELAPVFKENGIDSIICISVNDTFVMNEWKKNQEAENIIMLPDGNTEFSEKMGMLVDKSNLGFGKRSWRYSMLVNNGIIEKMFIEPEVEGDPFEVSDADTMLKYINSNARVPKSAIMFSRKGCPHCKRAHNLLVKHNIYIEDIILENGITSRSLRAVSGNSTTPQVFIDGKHVGGADELENYLINKE